MAERDKTTAYSSSSDQIGTIIAGRYKLLEKIGEGGMGEVWVADQFQPIRRRVALKLIKPGMDSRSVLARFEAERQALALMDHPNIAKFLDAGTTAVGRPFFVMELVKGTPITEFCDARKLSPRERLELFVAVCQAIQHAHTKGIIHRDIKPSNVLVALHDEQCVAKVIDFGVAKAVGQQLTEKTIYTGFGGLVGTPTHMAPEQAAFNQLDIDTRADVYALGILLYELLAGSPPVEPERLKKAALDEVLRLVREEEPPRPSQRLSTSHSRASIAAVRQTDPAKLSRLMEGELDWIVMKALEKDRNRRYQTASGFATDVQHYLIGEPVLAVPPSAAYRLRKFARRNKGRILAATALAAMLLLVIGLVIYGAWWSQLQATERRHEEALMTSRHNDALAATLDRAEEALKSGRLAEARTLLEQFNEQTPVELRDRHGRLAKDEQAVRELNEIFEERWMVSPTDTRMDNERVKKRYPALFHGYGLAVENEPAATVEKVRRATIAESLASGLTEWFFIDPQYPGLLAVVNLLDPEPTRTTMRRAIANGDMDYIKQLSEQIDGSQLSPAYAIGLALRLEQPMPLLRAAWTVHPNSFALVLTMVGISGWAGDKPDSEGAGWCRVAIALRPENALAHYFYAIAMSNWDKVKAIVEVRRAIQIAPRFAKAHGLLAFLLTGILGESGIQNSDEALAAARRAIELDDQNLAGNLVLVVQLLNRQDYSGAAIAYRKLADVRDWVEEFKRTGHDYHLSEFSILASPQGYLWAVFHQLPTGLLSAGRPYEAYRCCIRAAAGPRGIASLVLGSDGETFEYTAARAAALAGTGQGHDAPPLAERPMVRRRAFEWLTSELNDSKAVAIAACVANVVRVMGTPYEHGSLLLALPILAVNNPRAAEVHDRMNKWLSDSDFVGIRDEIWLIKLPREEQGQWRKLWSEARALRERTVCDLK